MPGPFYRSFNCQSTPTNPFHQNKANKSHSLQSVNLRPYKMNNPPTDATKCVTLQHQPLLSGASVSFCRGLVLWRLHVLHGHVCICFLSRVAGATRGLEDIGVAWIFWRLHQRYFNHLTCIIRTKTKFSLRNCIARLCMFHYKMTCIYWKPPPKRQHPWFGYKNAFFAHRAVRDWHVWRPLILMEWWAMGDSSWASIGQATSPGRSPTGFSGISCWQLA